MRRREYLLSLTAVGSLSGCLGDGSTAAKTSTIIEVEDSTPTESPTPSPTPSPTASPTATPTATPSLASIDEEPLGEAILDQVFEARGSTINHQGTLVADLDAMAKYHSDQMAQAREVAHVIDGETPDDRYQEFDLWCRFPNDVGRLYKHRELELVGVVSTRGVTVEDVAKRLARKWLDDPESKETLMIENADHVGIGVTIVPGWAYVTMVYC